MIGEYRRIESGATVLTTSGDRFTYTPAGPVELIRWGIIATVAAQGAGILAADLRPTAGSDTGRGTADGGTIHVGALAEGAGLYAEPTSRVKLIPGQQLVLEATTASATAGTVVFFLEVRQLPFVNDQNSDLKNMTKVTS